MTPKVIHCPTCGGPVDPRIENCSYCGNFLLHLSGLELSSKDNQVHFRSLQWLYKAMALTGLVICLGLYTVLFALFSEELLIVLSPIWFLCMHFGIAGLFSERAVKLVITRKARNFLEGLSTARSKAAPLVSLAVVISFFPVFMAFRLNRFSSPLKLAALTTAIWALLLYFFIFGIFPAL